MTTGEPIIPGFKTLNESDGKTLTSCILIVEDDPISAKLASNLLAQLGTEILIAVNGTQAVAYFESATDIDLVLMDLYLPDMSGIKTAEAIRATEHYRNRRVPILALTSNALMESKEQFLKSTGFVDYITKPPRKDTFPATVKKHLPAAITKSSWY